ncbi:MAG: hypothetical protein JXA06_11020 [Bacteroidetes bacterium]|nr:hypothetical protein [Bacteroidota bacterium]
MLWIDNIKSDINSIKSSPDILRKFGLLIGGVFLIISTLAFWRQWWENYYIFIAAVIGILLILFGIFVPNKLKNIHHYWMGFAIITGSIVSRIVLFLLFYLILSPLAVTAKIFKRRFFFCYKTGNIPSYWIDRENKKDINYERMG